MNTLTEVRKSIIIMQLSIKSKESYALFSDYLKSLTDEEYDFVCNRFDMKNERKETK